MTTHCREQQLPIDTVEVSFHINIEHPVVSPATLAGLAHRIDCRFAGSVAVGVGMKHRLQYRLQVTTNDFLGAAVSDSWNTQRPRTAPCFRNIDPPHRRRKVAPGGHAIPELVEVARKVGLERRNRLSIYSSRSLVRLHTFEGFPNLPFGDLERLCLVHGLIPLPDGFSWPMALAEQRSPLAPAPLQSLRHYYGLLRPCAPLRYSRPRSWSRLWLVPWHRRTGSHVPYKSLIELRAAYMPDAAWGVSGHPPSLSRGRERDLSGSQAIHPMPLPRSRAPAESTTPRLLTVSSMLPLLPSQQRLQRNGNFGA